MSFSFLVRLGSILTAFVSAACCASPVETLRSIAAHVWRVTDVVFSAAPPAQPFAAAFEGIVVWDDGRVSRVPGFYDGDDRWMIRFAPDRPGKGHLTTISSLTELHGQRLRVEVAPSPGFSGPIRIDPRHPSRFVHADGTAYFVLAHELDWLFALDAENPEDIPRTRRIISTLRRNGFNQIVMNVFAYDAKWGERASVRPEHNFARPTIFPFGGTNQNPDHRTLNPAFFQHLDRVIRHLDDAGMIAHLMIYVWNKQVNWPAPGSADDDQFFDYTVRRYQAFLNVIWDVSKEALLYGRDDMNYVTGRIDRLRAADHHRRLVTVHDFNYCRAHPEKVDFISIQEWTSYLYPHMRGVTDRFPDLPVMNVEHGGYETTQHRIFPNGAYEDAIACLDRAYQCIFAGSYATHYWQNTAWYEVIEEPQRLPPDRRPRLEYYQHLARIFQRDSFNGLYPGVDHGTPPYLTDREGLWLFYLAEGREAVTGTVTGMNGKRFRVTWIDPLTGTETPAPETSIRAGSWLNARRPPSASGSLAIARFERIP